MITSLSINKKIKYLFTSCAVVVLSILYLYYEYQNHKELFHQNIESEISLYYKLYTKTFTASTKQKNILIHNSDTINDDLVSEFAKSTPLMMDQSDVKKTKYSLTVKLIEKNTPIDTHLQKNINELENTNYSINFQENSVKLLGKVTDDTYVLIVKNFEEITQINSIIKLLFIKILFIAFFNICLVLYYIHLIKIYEQTQKELYEDFEQLQIDTKKVAFEDTLTGAATRLKFDETLKDLVNIASRFKEQHFTAIMIDIDNFKSVNDTYGHDYGDIVLKEVAKTVKNDIRKTDTFARWGGEEFVILSPMNSLENSNLLANKIRKKISEIHFDKLECVTCSFGLTQFKQGDTIQSIMKRSDDLLYKAKQNGKNRVEYL